MSKQHVHFNVCLGNPPYNLDGSGIIDEGNKTFAPPIYPEFFEIGKQIADNTVLITPARFLFNAGSTSKEWNEKILNSDEFKVLDYQPSSSSYFSNTDIKGGVAISQYSNTKKFSPIGIFTGNQNLNSILQKVINSADFQSIEPIVYSRTSYRLTKKLYDDFPGAIAKLSKGHQFDMSTNIFDRLPEVFKNSYQPDGEYVKIFGREKKDRTYKWIKRAYVNNVDNLDLYKVFTPSGSDGLSILGDKPVTILGPSLIAEPGLGATETFLSIGKFKTLEEASALLAYLKSKFCRTLIAILKVTPNTTPEKFKYVPLQNFSFDSDIDWTKSRMDIDQQLYKKYNLSPDEIEFIETHVKEME